ncbi:MAG TPA: helix-turn-helix domain-containing protein [Burkholderiales bacterium]|nr:helix-turn-helix domain-containing protein [Burkholderiales bacterium]
MNRDNRPASVAILALRESLSSVVFGMYDVFISAGRDWRLALEGGPSPGMVQPLVVAAELDAFVAANDVRIVPQAALADCRSPDIVCVADLLIPPEQSIEGRYARELAWLRERHAGGATVAATGSATMLLAEAGLLDGCEATTHWEYVRSMRLRYPKVKMRTGRALMVAGDDQRIVMAGGGTSWVDLVLFLIARVAGVQVAMQVARRNLIDWHDIGQQPFARLARSRQVDDARIAHCQSWIAANFQEPSPVITMVRLSGMPERSFKRRFQQTTGMAPLEYVHALRLEEAKRRLEGGSESIEAIAKQVGYEDAGFFSRLFRRNVHLTPAQYRRRFSALRRSLEAGEAPVAPA